MIPAAPHVDLLAPPDEILRRIAALQGSMHAQDLTLVWIDHLTDRTYYSGSAQQGVLLVPAEGEAVFHVRKSLRRAEVESPLAVRPYPGRRALHDEVRRMAGAGARVGLALDVTPAATYVALQQALADATIVDAAGLIRLQRTVKSAWELEQIRRASDQVTTLFAEASRHVRAGISEIELTGSVEGRLRALGHGGTVRVRRPGADVSIAVAVSGDSSLYPTNFDGPVGSAGPFPAAPGAGSAKRIVAGETVMLDVVTSHNGYHADTTRTFFVGTEVPQRALDAHELCRDVLRFLEARMRPGARCDEIYAEALGFVEQRGEPQGFMGYGENRVKFFGHGVGLELDEWPVLAARFDLRLEAGMVLAVEPKAFLQGVGPVGIENTYVITSNGCESLCPTDEGITVLR